MKEQANSREINDLSQLHDEVMSKLAKAISHKHNSQSLVIMVYPQHPYPFVDSVL